MEEWNEFPWATFTAVAVTLIAALAGAGVVVFGDEGALNFSEYLDHLGKFVIGIGLLGIGRGVRSGQLKSGARRATPMP